MTVMGVNVEAKIDRFLMVSYAGDVSMMSVKLLSNNNFILVPWMVFDRIENLIINTMNITLGYVPLEYSVRATLGVNPTVQLTGVTTSCSRGMKFLLGGTVSECEMMVMSS